MKAIEMVKSQPELWEFFTKKEEYKPSLLDKYQRFPSYASKHKDVFAPLVSSFLSKKGHRVEYPGQRRFAVCLTHDIDVIRFPKLEMMQRILSCLRQRKYGNSLKMGLGRLYRGWNPVWNFSKIMDLEEKYGGRSTFFFLCLERGDMDFSFNIGRLESTLKEIIERGWEVGLHGSHDAYLNSNKMREKKERLERIVGSEIIGYRNHYLKFKVPSTWEFLEEAGFKYDATFGYADCVGFRNGMCHPFRPFDLVKNKALDILELGLHIADFTLFEYMQLDIKGAWEVVKQIIDNVEESNGVLTLLWHNTYMIDEMFEFYEEILRYCQKKGSWITSGQEIWQWWTNKGFI